MTVLVWVDKKNERHEGKCSDNKSAVAVYQQLMQRGELLYGYITDTIEGIDLGEKCMTIAEEEITRQEKQIETLLNAFEW